MTKKFYRWTCKNRVRYQLTTNFNFENVFSINLYSSNNSSDFLMFGTFTGGQVLSLSTPWDSGPLVASAPIFGQRSVHPFPPVYFRRLIRLYPRIAPFTGPLNYYKDAINKSFVSAKNTNRLVWEFRLTKCVNELW